MGIAFVFSGLTLRPPRIVTDLPSSAALHDYVSTQLGWSLSAAAAQGGGGACASHAAVFCSSALALYGLRSAGLRPAYVAGHSLGQTAALLAAGSLRLPDAVQLVVARARVLHEFEERRMGSMAIVLTAADPVREAAARRGILELGLTIAAENAPGSFVVAGDIHSLRHLEREASVFGVSRITMFGVTVPYHSHLMKPATWCIARVLSDITIERPTIPLMADPPIEIVQTRSDVKDLLTYQICRPIHWMRTIQNLENLGADTFVEVGNTRTLTNLIQRINPKIRVLWVGDAPSLAVAVRVLSKERDPSMPFQRSGLDNLDIDEDRRPAPPRCHVSTCPA